MMRWLSVLIPAATLALLVGCSTPPLPAEKPAADPEEEAPAHVVHAGGGNLRRISDDDERRTLWTVSWKSAALEYTDEQQFGGKMSGVQGELFRGNVAVSTFSASEAIAERGSNVLKLVGEVKVVSADPEGSLVAQQLAYDGDAEVIVAAGGIEARSPRYVLAGMDAAFAEPDLTQVATPELFKREMTKETRSRLLAIAAAAAAVAGSSGPASAARQQGITFRDAQGNIEITGLAEWNISAPGDRATFVAKGYPGRNVTVRMIKQNVTLQAPAFEGEGPRTAQTFAPEVIRATGGVTAVSSRPSVNRQSSEAQTINVRAQTATFHVQADRLDVNGNVVLERTDRGANERMRATGASGQVLLTPQGSRERGIRTATLQGGVTMNMDAPQTTATGKASRLDFNQQKGQVDFSGNVALSRTIRASGQSMDLSGQSGRLLLGSDSLDVQSGQLEGNVAVVVKGTRQERQNGGAQRVPYTINGKSNRLQFSDAERTIIFTGNVAMTGDDPHIGGEIQNVGRAVFHLNAAGEVNRVEMQGDPGRTVIDDRRLGGGR
jgi:lipopolysaccharide export system protein LptA